jgi:cyclophilin family peptidyl-prolyl cis-trans isomerase
MLSFSRFWTPGAIVVFAALSWVSTAGAATPGASCEKQPHITPRVKFVTSAGDFVIELDTKYAPNTVKNFLQYVGDKHYDGLMFHRVIKDFMIQGGGYDVDFKKKPTRPAIANEANNGLKNKAYTIAMARTDDPNSATSQFFINTANNVALDYTESTPQGWGYAVFGKIACGEDTIEKIRNSPTGAGGPFPTDVPTSPIVIKTTTVLRFCTKSCS